MKFLGIYQVAVTCVALTLVSIYLFQLVTR
jgi:hypothetical protein